MACTSSGIGCTTPPSGCVAENGCISGVCPDFTIRRHDTKPVFKIKVEDCDGPLDLTDLVVEASMWAKGKLKTALTPEHTVLALADNIGFPLVMVGDIILMDQPRLPEKMLVLGFDEINKLIHVQRGYHGTPIQNWKRGSGLRIMKFTNATASSEMIYQDILEIDGTTTEDVLTDSFFVYQWRPEDTCLAGCYYMEFKLMKMVAPLMVTAQETVPSNQIPSYLVPDNVIPSFTNSSFTPSTFACGMNSTIEWIRRFPVDSEGFYIRIIDSPTVSD